MFVTLTNLMFEAGFQAERHAHNDPAFQGEDKDPDEDPCQPGAPAKRRCLQFYGGKPSLTNQICKTRDARVGGGTL